MNEKKEFYDVDVSDDFKSAVENEINRHYEQVTITGVKGECPYGHAEGQQFKATTMNSGGLCGSLYNAIHPSLAALHYGGLAPWETSPDRFSALCPEMGKVQVEVKRMQKDDFKLLRTGSSSKDMTGKGYVGIDRYSVTIEILGIEHSCTWRQQPGQHFEVDHFNVGGVCGYLYWSAYRFMNLLYAGGSVPWEVDGHVIHGICPDIYNQTAYRLIRRKR